MTQDNNSAAEAAQPASTDELRAALKEVTDVLDMFGDLADEKMCPEAWRAARAFQKVTAARDLLSRPAATSGEAPDLQQLKALALAWTHKWWYGGFQVTDGIATEEAVRFIVTVSPAVVLDLIARIERAAGPTPRKDLRSRIADVLEDSHLSIEEQEEVLARMSNRAAVSAATKPTADLPDENECWVHIYPSDLKRMERTETHATVFSVAVGRAGEVSVPLYTAEQVQSLLATKPAAQAVPEGYRLAPINPTPAMLEAARNAPLPMVMLDSMSAQQDLMNKSRYTAMIAAAPAAPLSADAAQEQARNDALEEAAAICEAQTGLSEGEMMVAKGCAAAVRYLKNPKNAAAIRTLRTPAAGAEGAA